MRYSAGAEAVPLTVISVDAGPAFYTETKYCLLIRLPKEQRTKDYKEDV